jgi:hypothetical protein
VAELGTTVTAYDALTAAAADWPALEQAAPAHVIELADAALVENSRGRPIIVHRSFDLGQPPDLP